MPFIHSMADWYNKKERDEMKMVEMEKRSMRKLSGGVRSNQEKDTCVALKGF